MKPSLISLLLAGPTTPKTARARKALVRQIRFTAENILAEVRRMGTPLEWSEADAKRITDAICALATSSALSREGALDGTRYLALRMQNPRRTVDQLLFVLSDPQAFDFAVAVW